MSFWSGVGDWLKDNPEAVNTAVTAAGNGINAATKGGGGSNDSGSLNLFDKLLGSLKIDAGSSQLDSLKTPLTIAGIALLALLLFSFLRKK